MSPNEEYEMGLTLEGLQSAIAEKGYTWIPNPQKSGAQGTGGNPGDADASARALVDTLARIHARHPDTSQEEVLSDLPGVVDWRDRGIVPSAPAPFPDQGSCHCSVSHAVTAMLAAMAVRELGLPLQFQLSPADSHFCGPGIGRDPGGWNPHDCLAQIQQRGVLTENAFPFFAAFLGNSGQPGCLRIPDRQNSCYFISNLSAANGDWRKWYLHAIGPMVAHMQVYEDFGWYGAGVYRRVAGGEGRGHAVLVIGYSDADQAWICRNSWGDAHFGVSPQVDGTGMGFFKIGYGECGIDETPFWGADGIFGAVMPSEIVRATRASGFTSLAPFPLPTGPHLFSYSASTGVVETATLPTDGSAPDAIWTGEWAPGWTSVKAFELGGIPYLFLHQSGTGDAAMARIEPEGRGTTETWKQSGSDDRVSLEVFPLSGEPYLLEYRAGDGRVGIDKINAGGAGTTRVWTGTWKAQGRSFSTFEVAGSTYLVQYFQDGAVAIEQFLADGGGTTPVWAGSWGLAWTHIVAFDLGGWPHLLRYQQGQGDMAIDRLCPGGQGSQEVYREKWNPDWTAIASFRDSQANSYFVEYKAGNGTLAIDKSKRAGN